MSSKGAGPHHETTESIEEPSELSDLLSTAQLEKLRLEVESLRNKNQWQERVAQFIPLITVFLAVAGFIFGIWQFQRQQSSQQEKLVSEQQKDRASQDLDRTLRIQNQIRTDTEQLLRFTNDPTQTLSRVAFLLDDLKVLAHQPVGDSQEGSQIILNSRETVTSSLIKMIHYDCDFLKNPRDVYFATTVFDHWPDYSKHLGQNLSELDFVLYKYVRALRDLHDKNPKYFEKLVYDSSSDRYIVNSESFGEEHQFQHYGDTVIGFMKHLSILPSSDLMKKHIQDFKTALRNPQLTEQLFSKYLSTIDSASLANAGLGKQASESDNLTIMLFPSAVRNAGRIQEILLNTSIRSFTLSPTLPERENFYQMYTVSIFDLTGKSIWRSENLKMTPPGKLTLNLNSANFTDGNYMAAIDGVTANGETVVIERYYFRVIQNR